MAKTNLVSGKLRIQVAFNDRMDQYKVKLCPFPSALAKHGRKSYPCETVSVGLPGAGPRSRHGKRLSVDDPRAMISAARAAISFSSQGTQDFADWRGNGAVVRPPKRRKRSR